VSADGRYVVFSTAQQLVPQDKNDNVDVYRRDMNVPLNADRKDSGAYTIVSAKDGGEEPATYAPHSPPLPGAEPGAEVWPNTAVSEDGRYVVFRTTEPESDLPDHSAVDTPPRELFVRDLQAKTTTLLSRKMTTTTHPSGDPAGGAVGPATISADGSTVSWVATNAPEQTPFLSGESPNANQSYYLWRRWQEPEAKTRRVTGIADPEDPGCHEGEEITTDPTASGPCYGPLTYPEERLSPIVGVAPGLDADGYTVAFLAGSALRPDVAKANGLDVFLTSMRPGVTRKSGTRELTLAASSGAQASTQSVESLALSPDGSTIAFTSLRDSFVLSEPIPIGSFRPQPTVSELYVIHLGANTLERAVLGSEGGDPNGSVAVDPTLSGDGSSVAFVSSASNLIEYDSHRQGFRDAFAATLQAAAGTATSSAEVNAAQNGFSLLTSASPELGLHVRRGKDGGLILLVETPGPGKLTAQALGAIATKVGRRTKKRTIVLARASGTARAEGTTTLVVRLASKYAKDLTRSGRLKALITVRFTPPAPAEALTAEASATFLAANAKTVKGVSKAKKGRH